MLYNEKINMTYSGLLDGFYIIKDGLLLFSMSFENKTSEEENSLIAGFLTALNRFANNIQQGDNIQNILIGKTNFSFVVEKEIIFVFKQKDLNPTILKYVSRKLIDKFFDRYETSLETWRGDLSIFRPFSDEVNELLDVHSDAERVDDTLDYVSPDLESSILEEMKQGGILNEQEIYCKICFMEIMENFDTGIQCPNGHLVHDTCLKEWLSHSQDCPVCHKKYSDDALAKLKNE